MQYVYIVLIDHMDEHGIGYRISSVYNSKQKAKKSDEFNEPFQSVKIEKRKVI